MGRDERCRSRNTTYDSVGRHRPAWAVADSTFLWTIFMWIDWMKVRAGVQQKKCWVLEPTLCAGRSMGGGGKTFTMRNWIRYPFQRERSLH
ncbi:MAG: hypothetical protein ACI8T1_000990 [Verrucomicrobiales bacterium]|jgi:hypothetical protein